jgi:hypothetical protein
MAWLVCSFQPLRDKAASVTILTMQVLLLYSRLPR